MWTDYIDNKESLDKTYGNNLLNPLRVLRVLLNEINATLTICADLPEFPQFAPQKWIQKEANTVQIELDFVLCENINIQSFSTYNVAELRVEKDELGELTFTLKSSDNLLISGTCNSIYLQRVIAYQNEMQ